MGFEFLDVSVSLTLTYLISTSSLRRRSFLGFGNSEPPSREDDDSGIMRSHLLSPGQRFPRNLPRFVFSPPLPPPFYFHVGLLSLPTHFNLPDKGNIHTYVHV